MANMKLKNFEYANLSVKAHNLPYNTDKVSFFESINGYVLLIADGEGNDEHSLRVSELAIERIKYYLVNEYVDSPSEALYNSLVYANGFIYEQARRKSGEPVNGVSLSCLLIRENTLYYCCIGYSRIYFFNGRKVYLLSQGRVPDTTPDEQPGSIAGSAEKPHPLLGKSKNFFPETNIDPLSPVNGDILLLASDGLYNSLNEKSLQKILADQMPVQTKVLRIANLANAEIASDNISLQLIAFYNIDYQSRNLLPDMKKILSSNKPDFGKKLGQLSTLKIKIEEYLKQPRYKIILTTLFIIIIGLMFIDIFFHNNRSAHQRQVVPTEGEAGIQQSEQREVQTGQDNLPANARIPADAIYLVKPGDTWGVIWAEFGVCSWFIRNHPKNTGKFDTAGNPIAGQRLAIPLVYSSIQRLNPSFYMEFSLEKTGRRCENVNEAFLENFRQNNP